jgi:hypothetical protein
VKPAQSTCTNHACAMSRKASFASSSSLPPSLLPSPLYLNGRKVLDEGEAWLPPARVNPNMNDIGTCTGCRQREIELRHIRDVLMMVLSGQMTETRESKAAPGYPLLLAKKRTPRSLWPPLPLLQIPACLLQPSPAPCDNKDGRGWMCNGRMGGKTTF